MRETREARSIGEYYTAEPGEPARWVVEVSCPYCGGFVTMDAGGSDMPPPNILSNQAGLTGKTGRERKEKESKIFKVSLLRFGRGEPDTEKEIHIIGKNRREVELVLSSSKLPWNWDVISEIYPIDQSSRN